MPADVLIQHHKLPPLERVQYQELQAPLQQLAALLVFVLVKQKHIQLPMLLVLPMYGHHQPVEQL